MLRQFRDRLESAPLPLRLLVCAALLKFLCAGFYLPWFTNGSDFALVHGAGAKVLAGQGAQVYGDFFAYRPEDENTMFFMYPPAVALFYAPLAALPFRAALTLFELLGLAAVLGVFAVWARHRRLQPFSEAYYLAFSAILLFFPLDLSAWLGQNDALVLFLVVLALAGKDRPWLSGLALASAVWLRVFLGFVLVYLLIQRRWRQLMGTVFWLAALAGLSLVFVPWSTQLHYFVQLGRHLGIESFYDNQSLTGLFYRALTDSGYTMGIVNAPDLARVLTALASLLLIAGFVSVTLRGGGEADFDEGFGLALVTALLLSPHSDTHHQALLLVPLLLFLERRAVRSASLLYYGFFAAFVPVIAFRFLDQERLIAFASGLWSLAYSIPVLVLLGFWFHCAAGLRREGLRAPGCAPARTR
ncbi:MAG: glycosyltransferase family 87 protein [Desulfovibrionaceae bacterium]|nr:glycosyltransferase family 87 protein [Desulfovibrionaceae bacterium]